MQSETDPVQSGESASNPDAHKVQPKQVEDSAHPQISKSGTLPVDTFELDKRMIVKVTGDEPGEIKFIIPSVEGGVLEAVAAKLRMCACVQYVLLPQVHASSLFSVLRMKTDGTVPPEKLFKDAVEVVIQDLSFLSRIGIKDNSVEYATDPENQTPPLEVENDSELDVHWEDYARERRSNDSWL